MQKEHMMSMREDTSQIKNQINDIQSSTEFLTVEHKKVMNE